MACARRRSTRFPHENRPVSHPLDANGLARGSHRRTLNHTFRVTGIRSRRKLCARITFAGCSMRTRLARPRLAGAGARQCHTNAHLITLFRCGAPLNHPNMRRHISAVAENDPLPNPSPASQERGDGQASRRTFAREGRRSGFPKQLCKSGATARLPDAPSQERGDGQALRRTFARGGGGSLSWHTFTFGMFSNGVHAWFEERAIQSV